LLAAAFFLLVALAWWYLAPTQIGGSTEYVVTTGVSMQPRFHGGDLAIVRPANTYRVGEIVAYRSTMLHVTVLHRIIGRDGDRYVFKGDSNNFIDPTRPTLAQLLGALWLRVPHGGVVLKFVHTPVVAAVLCSGLGLLLLFGLGEKRQGHRRRRSRSSGFGRQGAPPMRTPSEHGVTPAINWTAVLTASAAAGAVFLVLGLFLFTRAVDKATVVTTRYAQQVSFGYRAHAPAGPVYPDGVANTGDPIFAQLVHRLSIHIDYRVTTAARHAVTGTAEVLLRLTGTGGWSRTIVLAPRTQFSGDHTSTDLTLDLPHLQSLLGQVARLTGIPTYAGYSIAVDPEVHVTGVVAGQSLRTSFKPSLSFQLTATQLQPGASSTASPTGASPTGSSQPQAGFSQSQNGTVTAPAVAPATVTVLGISPQIVTLRWIALIGLLLSSLVASFAYLRKRREPFEESFRIQARYADMIVLIIGGEDLGWPPVDVPNIRALVRLAQSSERLILHNRSGDVDTYLVNDDGTVYRYQVRPSNVVWGEWSETAAPVQAAA
jgi:signal peptidase I